MGPAISAQWSAGLGTEQREGIRTCRVVARRSARGTERGTPNHDTLPYAVDRSQVIDRFEARTLVELSRQYLTGVHYQPIESGVRRIPVFNDSTRSNVGETYSADRSPDEEAEDFRSSPSDGNLPDVAARTRRWFADRTYLKRCDPPAGPDRRGQLPSTCFGGKLRGYACQFRIGCWPRVPQHKARLGQQGISPHPSARLIASDSFMAVLMNIPQGHTHAIRAADPSGSLAPVTTDVLAGAPTERNCATCGGEGDTGQTALAGRAPVPRPMTAQNCRSHQETSESVAP